MRTDKFKVLNLGCSACVAHTEEAIKGVDGVSNVAVNLEKGEATVTYDSSKTSPEQLKSAVQEAGYDLVI